MPSDVKNNSIHIAIIGGGPSALFMYQRLIESRRPDIHIDIFEKNKQLGAGMPYTKEGANHEHVTNVSDNEIPPLVTSIAEWVKTLSQETLSIFNIDPERFSEYNVLPRLLFGQYLSEQFKLLQLSGEKAGVKTHIHLNSPILDVIDKPVEEEVWIKNQNGEYLKFTHVVVCTGHHWPKKNEGVVAGYYDSPYPPEKLKLKLNHPIAIRGSSLTAIDAIRTLARTHGVFEIKKGGMLAFKLADDSPNFKIIMHSRGGFLPALRFHLEDSHLSKESLLTDDEISAHIAGNNGFLSLDFIFEKDFKESIRKKDSIFYERIRHMSVETFVNSVMELRERLDPFQLLKAEYEQAQKSIQRKESIHWKEALAVLSFAMNYPAKHFSAEDMLRLQRVLMPLISIVIAFVPQTSCKELLAMFDAGVLDIVAVGNDSRIEVKDDMEGIIYRYMNEAGQPTSNHYKVFIDCVGQPHLPYEKFPFKSLIDEGTVSPARLKFIIADAAEKEIENGNEDIEQFNGEYYLRVPGVSINDNFQLTDFYGAANPRIFMMAVPFIGGFNPDYSGLDFCDAASTRIVKELLKEKVL